MTERSRGWLWAGLVGLGIASMMYGGLFFLQTRSLAVSLFFVLGVPLLLATVAALLWVAGDIDEVGLPKAPWMVAIVLAPGIGLVGYLIARELAERTSPPLRRGSGE